jgi:hypothetical protein
VAQGAIDRTAAEVPDQIQQSGGRKQRSGRIAGLVVVTEDGHGQIRRTPRDWDQRTVLEADEDPGRTRPPENTTHPTGLAALGSSFRDHGHRRAAKCKIRRCLSRG